MIKNSRPDEQDAPWKKILRQYFREATEFFVPEIAQVVDWTKPIEFLDKEFLKIAPDAATGKRVADQLVKVQRKRGQAIFLLIHVEVQASREKGFAQRIFTYALRILDYFGQPATSVVILGDADPKWRLQQYGYALPGTSLSFEFTTVKLLDYRDQWAKLTASRNPFAWVVMAHLKMQETKRDQPSRKVWKLRLIRGLHESGYNHTDVVNLFNFIDWILSLPPPLEVEFWQELKTYEEDCKVPYITSVERIGYARGKKEGRTEGRQEAQEEERQTIALNMLKDNLPLEQISRLTRLTTEQVQQLQAQTSQT